MAQDSSPGSPASSSFLRVLRRRLWLIALCALLVPAAVVAYSLAQTKEYRASATLLAQQSGPSSLLSGTSSQVSSTDQDRQAATDLSLAALPVVAARTASRLGIAPGDVASRVALAPVGTSDLTTVSATDTSPVVAATLANAYADELVRLRRASAIDDVHQAQAAVDARLSAINGRLAVLQRIRHRGPRRVRSQHAAEGRALAGERDQLLQRQGDLGSLASATTGNVELAQRADAPSTPISPKPRRNGLIGLGLGVVLGIALALLFEMLDRRLHDPAELGQLVDLPVLGAIPRSRALAEPPGLAGLPVAESQAFHMLRTSLRYYNDNRDLGSVLITSAGPRDGKTTVAWNLAAVSARAGERVLLLEADLRQPSLADRCRVETDRGVTDVLRGTASFAEVVNEVVVAGQRNGSSAPCTLDVIVAGTGNDGIAGLIESPGMDHLIRLAQELYDLVVIDTPPMSVVPDAIPLMTKVGGVIVVTRLGRTTRDAVSFLTSQLGHIGAPALGTVVNGITRQDGYYGAMYGGAARPRAGEAPEPSLAHH
ncbi:MAG: tyrosine-protein kinase [Solirubrobacteraceae bacterium]|jgi:capsular exopolysaccharide synthesis family protein|nr:tyrosine-protein kinase [Solirubrobacteraceae bacterium]